MSEEERRQDILKAEESIRLLAKEMAHASDVSSQAEAARKSLDAARSDVAKSVHELNEAISTQKATNTEAMVALDQAKRTLENAISSLADVGVHIDRIEIHINEAVTEIRATAKIIEFAPKRLSAALSRELSQADKSLEEKHVALVLAIEDKSKTFAEALNSQDNKLSQIDSALEEKQSASMQILENNSNKLKEISQSIDDTHKNISNSLDTKFLSADRAGEQRHVALMQAIESKSKTFAETLNSQNIKIVSLARWGIIFAALALIGIWISAIILLIRS